MRRFLLASSFSFLTLAGACSASIHDSGTTDTGGHSGSGGSAPDLCPSTIELGAPCNQIGLVCGSIDNNPCPHQLICESGAWSDNGPAPGRACSIPGQRCPSPVGCNGEVVCTDGNWQSAPGDDGGCCIPLTCPATLPTAGEPCADEPLCDPAKQCTYRPPCNWGGSIHATCEAGVWKLDPPAFCGCVGADESTCKSRSDCRWVGPACGDAGATVGFPQCEPIAGCASPSDCPPGYACSSVAVDPCPGGSCGSCSIVVPECVQVLTD